jgi:TetR/AcrR family transcriptional repressor of nem operon
MYSQESTRRRALREASGLLQTVGFNGFSLQDVADRVGIRKPSLYAHFASKAALGQALIADYQRAFTEWTDTIDGFSPLAKIEAYFDLAFRFSSRSGKFCPLVALVGDFHSFPPAVRRPIAQFYRTQRRWMEKVIRQGQREKRFRKDRSAESLAPGLLSLALGAQLIACVTAKPRLLQSLKAETASLVLPQ